MPFRINRFVLVLGRGNRTGLSVDRLLSFMHATHFFRRRSRYSVYPSSQSSYCSRDIYWFSFLNPYRSLDSASPAEAMLGACLGNGSDPLIEKSSPMDLAESRFSEYRRRG